MLEPRPHFNDHDAGAVVLRVYGLESSLETYAMSRHVNQCEPVPGGHPASGLCPCCYAGRRIGAAPGLSGACVHSQSAPFPPADVDQPLVAKDEEEGTSAGLDGVPATTSGMSRGARRPVHLVRRASA